MSLEVKFNVVPPLPEEVGSDIVIEHATNTINTIREEENKKKYAEEYWNMRPVLDNFNKLILYYINEKLKRINTYDTIINTHEIMKKAWHKYLLPNLDEYQQYTLFKKYINNNNLDSFLNSYFHVELENIIKDLLIANNWPIRIEPFHSYNCIAQKIYINFDKSILNNI